MHPNKASCNDEKTVVMNQIVLALFPPIALIASGYVLQKRRFLATDFWNGTEKLNYYLFFPALLFASLARAQVQWVNLSAVIWAMLTVVLIAVAALCVMRRVKRILPAQFGVYVQGLVRFNTYIGIAVVSSLAQGMGASILAVVMAVCIPVVNVISIISLLPKEQMNVGHILKSLLKNPLISSCLAGVLVNITELPLWAGFWSLLQLFSNCSLALGLLCVGAALQFGEVRRHLSLVFANSLGRLLLMPLLAYGVSVLFGLDPVATQVLVIFFGLPTASASYILTKVLKGDAHLMAGIISLQTLLSVLSLPLLMYLTDL